MAAKFISVLKELGKQVEESFKVGNPTFSIMCGRSSDVQVTELSLGDMNPEDKVYTLVLPPASHCPIGDNFSLLTTIAPSNQKDLDMVGYDCSYADEFKNENMSRSVVATVLYDKSMKIEECNAELAQVSQCIVSDHKKKVKCFHHANIIRYEGGLLSDHIAFDLSPNVVAHMPLYTKIDKMYIDGDRECVFIYPKIRTNTIWPGLLDCRFYIGVGYEIDEDILSADRFSNTQPLECNACHKRCNCLFIVPTTEASRLRGMPDDVEQCYDCLKAKKMDDCVYDS